MAAILRRSKVETRLFSYGLCPSLADHEARDARTSIDCHRNYQRAVALFPYSRVTTTVSRVASQFCRKNNIQPPPLPSFPRLSNYLFSHRHLSPSLHTPGLTLSPFPLLHTHIRMHKPSSSTASLVHPFVLPLFSTIPLSLSFSLFILRSLGSISLSLAPVLEKERNRDVGEERDT